VLQIYSSSKAKTENSNLNGFDLHKPSIKGTKLLSEETKAIFKSQCKRRIIRKKNMRNQKGKQRFLIASICNQNLKDVSLFEKCGMVPSEGGKA